MPATIVALATPLGVSAIAKVRISGPLVKTLCTQHFPQKQTLVSHQAFLAHYTNINGQILDQVIAIFFDAAHSYTGEDALEIDCHGNPLVIHLLIEDLIASGCQMAGPGEFTQRAYLNHRIDLCQAEAVLDVIHATNEAALTTAQRQLQGSLSHEITRLSEDLLNLLAELEAAIDFSDEDLPISPNIPLQIEASLQRIDGILQTHRYRERLLHGVAIAIIGAPNAGKSSLLNALLGEERALVSAIPGTTRDFIRENLVLDDIYIHIIDTAGLRDTRDAVEQLGIEKTLQNIRTADLCLLVIDQNDPQFPDSNILQELTECILVWNKSDLPKQQEIKVPSKLNDYPSVTLSAKNQNNIAHLKLEISSYIRARALLPPESAIVINERHREIFEKTRTFLRSAYEALQNRQAYELCASDIRQSLEQLGYIVGRYNTEAMLGKIFERFCVGK